MLQDPSARPSDMVSAMDLLGFWSYVHADDEVDMGRVAQLGRDIVAHYEAIKAESIQLFLDRDDLHWGDEWRDKVDAALSNVAFFIPVITPRYFTRPECRREFEFFSNKAEGLGITELILPILYIDVPELHDEGITDPIIKAVQKIQWEPWGKIRFADRNSGEYRAAVDALARELVRRVGVVERADVVAAAVSAEESSDEDEAGVIDKIAALEAAMPRWTATMESLQGEIEAIGAIMTGGTDEMSRADAQGKGFAARLTVARRLATDLAGPVGEIEKLGQSFAADLGAIDAGVRMLLEHGVQQARDSGDPEAIEQVREFMDTIRSLSISAHDGLGALEQMIVASSDIEAMSKDMRAPLRRLRNSLTAMVQARETTDEWLELVNAVQLESPSTTDGASRRS